MFGAAGALMRLIDLADRLLSDTQLREKFEERGRVAGRLQIDEYDLYFELKRRDVDE